VGAIGGQSDDAEKTMKYGMAWSLGVPFSIVVLWFLANQMGC
jgi:hypothetical protein